jgi:glycosyltransferase involved in cell wall biosynthesis
MNKLLSVIVPVYNPGACFARCMDSILNQTYKNLEIILVNDGSTDGSEELCHKYAMSDSRVKIIDQTNQGVVAAKKKGVLAATGEFIGYVDSDDYIELDYFENMLRLQEENQADIVAVGHFHEIGGKCELKKNDLKDGVYSFPEIADRVLYAGRFFEYGIGPHLVTKIFRSDILKSACFAVPYNIMAGDDAAVVYPCLAKADRICVSGMAGYHYVQHMNSVTKVSFADEKKRVDVLVNYLANAMGETGYAKEFEPQLRAYRNYLLALRDIEQFDEGNTTLLMPFGGLLSNEKVVIYGAGVLGQKLHRYLTKDGRQNVKAWLDRNYETYQDNSMDVDSPERLDDSELLYDYILVANISEDSYLHIKSDLVKRGVNEDRIRWFTPEFCGRA